MGGKSTKPQLVDCAVKSETLPWECETQQWTPDNTTVLPLPQIVAIGILALIFIVGWVKFAIDSAKFAKEHPLPKMPTGNGHGAPICPKCKKCAIM